MGAERRRDPPPPPSPRSQTRPHPRAPGARAVHRRPPGAEPGADGRPCPAPTAGGACPGGAKARPHHPCQKRGKAEPSPTSAGSCNPRYYHSKNWAGSHRALVLTFSQRPASPSHPLKRGLKLCPTDTPAPWQPGLRCERRRHPQAEPGGPSWDSIGRPVRTCCLADPPDLKAFPGVSDSVLTSRSR